jgi:hypothetical protein
MADDRLSRRLPPLVAVTLLVVAAAAAPATAGPRTLAQADITQPAAATGASRGLVVVLSPGTEDEVTRNAMARILGELGAAPFTVINKPLDANLDVMGQLETAGQDLAPVAAFAIVRDAGDSPQSVAVWVSNRMTRTTSVHRVAIRAGDVDGAAAELAIEAVELVRASMAGLWPSPPAAERAPDSGAATETARHAGNLALSIGAGVVAPLENAPLFFAPTAGVSITGQRGTGLRLWVTGLGPGAEVSAANGAGARLQRAAGTLGAVQIFRADAAVQPMLSLGVGLQYLRVRGIGATPANRLHEHDSWTVIAAVGAGLAFVLGPHVALTAEIDALLALPAQVVQVDGAEAATFRWPSLFVHGGVLARL